MTRADRAEQLFREGYNCSQSVFGAFADVLDMDFETAMKYASPFGAGFGKLREVCGAISGMTMVVGLKAGYYSPADREGKIQVYHMIQDMTKEFTQTHPSIICRELLGILPGEDLPEPAVRTEQYYQERPCIGAVRSAAEITARYLNIEDITE